MQNKKEVSIEFIMLCANGKAHKAFEMYVHEDFIHHNAYFKGDAITLMEAMDESALGSPDKIFEIKRVIHDGDLVVLHSFIQQNAEDRGAAVVHILRFHNDKIIEMWDLGQPLPDLEINENGMF